MDVFSTWDLLFFESKPCRRFDRVWEVIHSTNVIIKESTTSLSPTCWSQARCRTVIAYDAIHQKENATDWEELHNLLWLTDGDRREIRTKASKGNNHQI
jgi:hypothetical protein